MRGAGCVRDNRGLPGAPHFPHMCERRNPFGVAEYCYCNGFVSPAAALNA